MAEWVIGDLDEHLLVHTMKELWSFIQIFDKSTDSKWNRALFRVFHILKRIADYLDVSIDQLSTPGMCSNQCLLRRNVLAYSVVVLIINLVCLLIKSDLHVHGLFPMNASRFSISLWIAYGSYDLVPN